MKTDKVDAQILAWLLAADYLPAVCPPDAAVNAPRRPVVRFLIREHDCKFSQAFDTVVTAAGVHIVTTPIQAPGDCCIRGTPAEAAGLTEETGRVRRSPVARPNVDLSAFAGFRFPPEVITVAVPLRVSRGNCRKGCCRPEADVEWVSSIRSAQEEMELGPREEFVDIPQELIDAFTSGRDELLAVEGVLGASIGQAEDADGQPTGDVSIRVHVSDVNSPPAGLPADVGGYAPVLVRRGDILLDADTAPYNPIVGSCSVANVDRPQPDPSCFGHCIIAGTLGAIARDNATGGLVGLTNYHVLCRPGFTAGDQIEQPQPTTLGRTAANRLGELLRWTTFSLGFLGATQSAICDAAICTIERTGSLTVMDIGTVSAAGSARLGDLVTMRGKETAQKTEGIVTGLFAAVLSPVSGGTWLLGQIEMAPAPLGSMMSQSGDSGSLIVNDNDEAVGLFWGEDSNGNRHASDITSVCADLSISLSWPIPQVQSLSLATGAAAGGDSVTITGIGFQLASDVTFDGVSCPVFNRVPASDSEIVAITPAGSGVVDVLVTAPGGTSGAGQGPTYEFK